MLFKKGAKKCLLLFMIVQTLYFKAVPVRATSNPYKTIREIAEGTSNRWQDTFKNARGEVITIDCPISVPDVDKAPVVRVTWYPPLNSSFVQEFQSPNKSWTDATSTYFENMWSADIPKNLGPNDYEYIETYVSLEDVEWDRAYCENRELTPRQAFDVLQKRAEDVYMQYGSAGYYPMEPAHGITIVRLEDKKGNFLWDAEIYDLTGYELIHGIPILGNVAQNYSDLQKFESIYEPRFYFLQIQNENSYCFGAHLVKEEGILYDDIPLVDFGFVKPEIEKLIEEGRIRDVHHVSLGYVLYLESNHSEKSFQLIPSWMVECDYFQSAKEEADLYVDTLNGDN